MTHKHTFSVVTRGLWNGLPLEVRKAAILKLSKADLFKRDFCTGNCNSMVHKETFSKSLGTVDYNTVYNLYYLLLCNLVFV